METFLAGLSLVEERPTVWREPEGAERRSSDAVTTYTSPDGRTVTERYADGTLAVARLEGPEAPGGAAIRLIPVAHPGSWPHYALLVSGLPRPLPFIGAHASDLEVPLVRRALRAGEPEHELVDAIDLRALADTVRLRHYDCPEADQSEQACFYFGSEAALRAVTPSPGGWSLIEESLPRRLPGPWAERRPLGGGEGPLVIRGFDGLELPEGSNWAPARIELRVGGRHYPVVDDVRDPAEWGGVGDVIDAGGERIVVIRYLESARLIVTRHAPSGRRRGRPRALYLYSGEEMHGGAQISMHPVRMGRGLGVAVAFGGGDMLLYPPGETEGTWMLRSPEDFPDDPDETYGSAARPALLEVRRCDDVPCLAVVARAPARPAP